MQYLMISMLYVKPFSQSTTFPHWSENTFIFLHLMQWRETYVTAFPVRLQFVQMSLLAREPEN